MPRASRRPMLATGGARCRPAPSWAYEFKWDGVRALAGRPPRAGAAVPRRGRDRRHRRLSRARTASADLAARGRAARRRGGRAASTAGRRSRALAERMHVRDAGGRARLAGHAAGHAHGLRHAARCTASISGCPYVGPSGDARAALERSTWRPALEVPPGVRRRAGDCVAPPASRASRASSQAARVDLPAGTPQPRLGQAGASADRRRSWSAAGGRDRQPDPHRRAAARRRPTRAAALSSPGGSAAASSAAPQRDLLPSGCSPLRPGRRRRSPSALPREAAECALVRAASVVVEVRYGARTADGRLRQPIYPRAAHRTRHRAGGAIDALSAARSR